MHILVPVLGLLFAQPNLSARLMNGLFDQPFSGIYRLSPFDWALLIPYFGTLFILSIYGVHRYETIRRYRKYRKNLPKQATQKYEQLPRVTVQLPLYNERFVVERLLEETAKLDYPRELLQIQVLDDSTDETRVFTERLCNEYRASGLDIEYRHRTNRHGFKAGAL
ncbi:MAG: glycosyltransferase, partial [Acidobacteriaceae bacterium]|nr:glycosyltransferase [Acidobacteriaceae bacterium]